MTAREALEARRRRLSPVQLDRFKVRLSGVNPDSGGHPGIERGGDGAPAPLSSVQERLWFLNEFEPRPDLYNRPANLRLEGPLDRVALQNALREIVRRHDVLRSRIGLSPDLPWMELVPDCELTVEERDLRSLPSGEREHEAKRRLNEENLRAFDLAAGPMVRACLIRLEDDEHWLAVTFHHIAFDGWSEGVLWRELGVLYTAFAAGRPSPLPELSLRYADFAVWQRRLLERGGIHSDLAYWCQQLRGAPSMLDLPTDFPRPKRSSNRGGHHVVRIEGALVEALRNLGQREGATLFMTLLAGFQVLLFRLSGQEDLCVGTPIAGRSHPEVENLIGCFINTLVVRTDLSGNPTFLEVLKRVRGTTLDAYAHQDLPFEKLVAELSPQRSLGHAPLFQVMFVFQNAPSADLEFSELTVEQLELHNSTAKFDLTLSLAQRDGQLRGTLEFSTDLFEAATIERMIGHFHFPLEGVVHDAGQPIGLLPMLSADERHRLLHQWSQSIAGPLPPAADLPSPPPEDGRPTDWPGLPALFAAQVTRTPDAVALVCGDISLTYGELNTRSLALAQLLRGRGVVRGSAVALYLDRSPDFAVSVLAILHAGGCYVPLPLEYPPARLRFILEDSRSSLILSHGPLPDDLCLPGCHALDLNAVVPPGTAPVTGRTEDFPLQPAGDARGLVTQGSAGSDPAYVMYTSGSTGRPRGVVIPHRAVARLVLRQSFADFGPSLRTLLLAPLAFDASTFEFWAPLLHGGTCVIFPDRNLDPQSLERALREGRVNCLWLTAALFNQLLDLRPSALESVAHILTGGEVLSVPHIVKARALLPRTRLTNGYGPTECTTFACTHAIGPDEAFTGGSVPIGRPIANTSAYVLDARGQPVPIGIPGELYLGGDGLALGYLGQPELTAERFVPDPFGRKTGEEPKETQDAKEGDRSGAALSSPFVPFGHASASAATALNDRTTTGEPKEAQDSKEGEQTGSVLSSPFVPFGHPPAPAAPILEARLYRTGDRVRWRADGTLEFLGRMDDQVKIRGHRIEPAEIECALRRHPSVQEAWVVVRTGSDGGRRLVAWCQTVPGSVVAAAYLRGFLRKSLPELMVPVVTVSAELVPLTPNGKVDANAVPLGSDEPDSVPEADPTTTEAMMADLWCRLLGVQRVGLDENFFDLGGHSLLSLRLLEQIQQLFQTRLAPREFFENPTVRSLSARVWDDMVRPGRSRNHSPDQRLVPLQSGGSLPPIFVFPGGYGDESELITVAWMSRRHLGPGQPLYALLGPGVDGFRTLAEEARDCLVEMRRVHPRGPWFLIGLCVGGNLAFEVAKQAQETGDAVPMLALADCHQPRRFEYLRACLRDPGRGPRQYLMNTLYHRTPWMRGLLTAVGRRQTWKNWFGSDTNRIGIPEASDLIVKDWAWRAYQHGEGILSRQMSPPRGRFEGRIDLFVSQEMIVDDRVLRWREQATLGAEVLALPGKHSTYLIDGAPLIAERFRCRLQALGEPGSMQVSLSPPSTPGLSSSI
jgi:amino acid adenylation domain-containing protein